MPMPLLLLLLPISETILQSLAVIRKYMYSRLNDITLRYLWKKEKTGKWQRELWHGSVRSVYTPGVDATQRESKSFATNGINVWDHVNDTDADDITSRAYVTINIDTTTEPLNPVHTEIHLYTRTLCSVILAGNDTGWISFTLFIISLIKSLYSFITRNLSVNT